MRFRTSKAKPSFTSLTHTDKYVEKYQMAYKHSYKCTLLSVCVRPKQVLTSFVRPGVEYDMVSTYQEEHHECWISSASQLPGSCPMASYKQRYSRTAMLKLLNWPSPVAAPNWSQAVQMHCLLHCL